jgi:cytosine/adenosine deaminase-related metal-dependent hydrolase
MSTHESLRDQIVASSSDPQRRIVIRSPTVITMDPALGDFPRADILIEGTTITAIGEDLEVADGSAIAVDGEGFVAIPGLHDTHRHSWQSAFRRMFVDIGLDQYLETLHGRLAPCYRPEDMQIGNLLTGLGALDSGITCVMDFSHNTRSYDHATACVEGWDAAGIRAVFGCCAPAFGEVDERLAGDPRAVAGGALLHHRTAAHPARVCDRADHPGHRAYGVHPRAPRARSVARSVHERRRDVRP